MHMKGFRVRARPSGKVYYFFDAGGKPRKELPLGCDYIAAVRKWADLASKQHLGVIVSDFKQLADKYAREEIVLKATSTQATQRSDLKLLLEFFCTPTPAPLDQIKPPHVHALLKWKKSQPTTANRLKRLFSHMYNKAREWGYTDQANPAAGIKGYTLDKRDVYISDKIYKLVWQAATQPIRDVMDLAYLTGQRPGDVLKLTDHHIQDGFLVIKKQNKTGRPLRIRIEGEFGQLLERITQRKDGHKVWCTSLATNAHGMPLTKQTLRDGFTDARAAAIAANPKQAEDIAVFWFYDLRAKAADDTADEHDDQAAADLLGHLNVSTTKRHYLRRGKKVGPTK